MLMDDHRLVLIRNTDMGCYRDRGLNVRQRVSVCAAIWKEKQHSQKKDPQNPEEEKRWRRAAQHIHPPIHLHQYFNSLISWVRYDLSLRTTITANDIYIRYLY